jgi:hypothetical protein
MGYITPGATFDHLMTDVSGPLGMDVAVTLNYGSNRACNAGGEPSEAAAWVALGTLLKAGVPMATWWLAYGSCDETGDYSKKLYGGSTSAVRPCFPTACRIRTKTAPTRRRLPVERPSRRHA